MVKALQLPYSIREWIQSRPAYRYGWVEEILWIKITKTKQIFVLISTMMTMQISRNVLWLSDFHNWSNWMMCAVCVRLFFEFTIVGGPVMCDTWNILLTTWCVLCIHDTHTQNALLCLMISRSTLSDKFDCFFYLILRSESTNWNLCRSVVVHCM